MPADLDAELRRLRLDLYRPDPPPDALERYEALSARLVGGPLEQDAGAPTVAADAVPAAPGRRRRALVAAGVVLVVLAALVAAVLQLVRPEGEVRAEPVAGGAADRARLAFLLGDRPSTGDSMIDGDPVVDVLRRTDLPQLAVWRQRRAGASVLRGEGPEERRYGTGEPGSAPARPLSFVVRCDRNAAYRWTVRGSTPARPEPHVLATAGADRCTRPTVATFVLPAGAGVSRFDLDVPRGVRWGMTLVYPTD